MASLKEVFYDAGELLTSNGSVHPRYFRFISGELRLFSVSAKRLLCRRRSSIYDNGPRRRLSIYNNGMRNVLEHESVLWTLGENDPRLQD